jgi:hypothetical protein
MLAPRGDDHAEDKRMKTTRVLRWVIMASVGTIAACGGVSDIGRGDNDPNGMGNTGKGGSGVGATGSGTGGKAGAPMGVGGGAPVGSECMADFDCAVDAGPCQMCEDGGYACPSAVCVGNKCVHGGGTCATTCETEMDCPVLDIACTECGDGSTSCPVTKCTHGVCETSFPGCGDVDPCANQACGAECKPCGGDGMCAPDYASYCSEQGKCVPGIPQCGMDPGTSCDTAMDCPIPPPECIACGNDTCAGFECIESKCVFTCPANPHPVCMSTDDCPPVDAICRMCPGGECAEQACLDGACRMVCKL